MGFHVKTGVGGISGNRRVVVAAVAVNLLCAATARAGSLLLSTTPNIGAAGGFALLSTGIHVGDSVDSSGTVNGNVGVGPHGSLTVGSGGTVNGTVFLDNSSAPASFVNGGPTGPQVQMNLTGAITAAETASSDLAANSSWNQTFGGIGSGTTINSSGTVTYVDVTGDINLFSGAALNFVAPSAGDYFVVNVTGSLALNSTASINVSGINANHLFINILSTDSNVAVSFESGSTASGIFLATRGGMTAGSGAVVTGALIGDGNQVSVDSGAVLNGDPPPAVPLPSAVSSGFMLLGGLGLMAGVRRFKAKPIVCA